MTASTTSATATATATAAPAPATLEALLAEAEAQQQPQDLDHLVNEYQEKAFAVAPAYKSHAQDFKDLVKPLRALLPTLAEYADFASPREGRKAGPFWKEAKGMDPVLTHVNIENPGMVILTQCKQTGEQEIPYAALNDEEYTDFLDSMGRMADWWEMRHYADDLQLAKSIIVHTVLKDPLLRARTLLEAQHEVDCLVKKATPLVGVWRDDR